MSKFHQDKRCNFICGAQTTDEKSFPFCLGSWWVLPDLFNLENPSLVREKLQTGKLLISTISCTKVFCVSSCLFWTSHLSVSFYIPYVSHLRRQLAVPFSVWLTISQISMIKMNSRLLQMHINLMLLFGSLSAICPSHQIPNICFVSFYVYLHWT